MNAFIDNKNLSSEDDEEHDGMRKFKDIALRKHLVEVLTK